MKSIKAIFRRGQNAKIDGQNLPDNLSRTSSITNIDVEQKQGKGAKPRKSASKERIDKVGEIKKNEKKGVTKNNNKLESTDSPYPSIDSLQEEEFVQLRRQLQEMAQEKSNLALQLGEQKGQLNMLQKEIQSLKSFQEESNLQLEQLTEENTALRNRLRDVAHSPLSDNEKQQLLYETHHRHHSSAPASIATNLIEETNGGDITACPTPDWDKHSSSNVSEVSVACLQDKINQMQETHYSTNEELQATLQELTDLQRQLTELQQENERLNEEKTLMFDSLCRQTERLNDSRSEVESLKQLLYREKDESGQYESAIEREQKLVELLKTSQEEKQALLVKLEQVSNELQEARTGIAEKEERINKLSERVRTLESTLDAKHAEHRQLDQELAQAKDQCSGKHIEINRLTDLLDNARTKIIELEQDRELIDKSELDELLDNARKEKDSLESEVAHLKEQLAISKNEIEKLREQVSILQEECKVTRNNARTTQCDLEYKLEKLSAEKNNLNEQLLEFQEAINELQVQSQCQLEDKRQLSAVLSETQRNLSEAERKNLTLENELQELKKVRTEEVEEWEKFQNDLLTSVRVANDFKTEAQQELQRMIMENKSYREKERQLKSEIEKLKGERKSKREELSQTDSKHKTVEKQDMENLLGLSRRSRDKQRRSKDNIDVPLPLKDDKSKDKKPDNLTKMVKKREKPTRHNKKNKTLSVEEEILLKSLNDWYENIDKNIPEEQLTEEQKVVKKLKVLYEDDSLKEKPVAHKPKNQLAISKPLLDSVFLNPKLEEIAKDPNMPTIEEMENLDLLSYGVPELRNLPELSDHRGEAQSVDFTMLKELKRSPIIGRSKSCDDLQGMNEKINTPVLYRSTETDDLRQEIPLVQIQRESSILPSDSVSNPRYSDFATVIDSGLRQGVETVPEVNLTRQSSVNYETLKVILASIPKDASQDQLTSEQKFALKLKKALDEAERKNTLKRIHKKKQVIISSPTVESVQKNAKLNEILLNPQILSVRRYSEADNIAGLYFKDRVKQSKSVQDISFSFDTRPNKDNKSIDSTDSTLGDSYYGFNTRGSITDTFSSGEIDTERNLVSPYEVIDLTTFKENKEIAEHDTVDSRDRKNIESPDYDLLYNETLTKKNKDGVNDENKEKVSSFEYENVPSPTFKVKSFESSEVGKKHYAVIVTPQQYSVLSDPDPKIEVFDISQKPKEESKINRPHSVTVIPLEEYVAVLSDLDNKSQSPDHNLANSGSLLKWKPVEEETYTKKQSTAVTNAEEHTSILSYSDDKGQSPNLAGTLLEEDITKKRSIAAVSMPENIKIKALEDENVTKIQSTVVFKPEEHLITYKLQNDEEDVVKIHSTVVSTPNEYFTVYKLQNNDEDVAQIRSTIVLTPEEHITIYKLQSDKEDVVKIRSTAVSTPDEYLTVYKLQNDDEDVTQIRSTIFSTPEKHTTVHKLQNDDENVAQIRSTIISTPEEYTSVYKLQNGEEDIGKIHSTIVSTPEEHLTEYKLQSDEENLANFCSTTVCSPEEHSALHKLQNAEKDVAKICSTVVCTPKEHSTLYKLQSNEDNITKIQYTVVSTPEEHFVDYKELRNDDFHDLTYNETINKKLIHKHGDKIDDGIKRESTVPDIIVDVTDSLISSKEEYEETNEPSEKNLTEVFADERSSDLEDASLHLNYEEDEPEYDYHAILKENRYGVISPLNIRLSYKDVVKEIKTKFSPQNEPNILQSEDGDDDDDDDLAQSNTFLDEFFGTACKDEIKPHLSSSDLNNIDVEMEEIFEKYLHTPVSKVITQIGSSVDNTKSNISEPANDEVIDEVSSATNFPISENSDKNLEEDCVEEIVLIIDNVQNAKHVEITEDLQNITEADTTRNITSIDKVDYAEEMIDESYITDTSRQDQEMTGDKILSHNLDKEQKYEEPVVESVNKSLCFVSNRDNLTETTDADNNLSEEERKLVRSLTNIRFSRPLSDFSEKDLRLIETLSAQYLSFQTPKMDNKPSKDTDLNVENTVLKTEELEVATVMPSGSFYKEKINTTRKPNQDENIKTQKVEETIETPQLPNIFVELTENIEPSDRTGEEREHSKDQLDTFAEQSKNEFINSNISIMEDERNEKSETQDENELVIRNVSKMEDDRSKHTGFQSSPFIVNKQKSLRDQIEMASNEPKQHDEDDVNVILAKISSPTGAHKRRTEKHHSFKDIEIKDGKPKVILRNAKYEGVKSKLEFFAKQSGDSNSTKRQSLNPNSHSVAPDRRKVKSWAEHFEKRSLDTHKTYEPVYANLETLDMQKRPSVTTSKIDKKPLPVPRLKNLGSTNKNYDNSSDIRDVVNVNEMKMSDCKIISENDAENLTQEHPGSDFSNNIGKINVPDIPAYSETSNVILEGSPIEVEHDGGPKTCVLGVNRSEKFLAMRDSSHEVAKVNEEDSACLAAGAESSFSSIAVAGKFEQLDITKNSDMEEISTTNNESHLNLFHLETPSYDESYLSLFKSPEDKVYEDISGTRRPQTGYLNFAYLGEVSDSESCEEINKALRRERLLKGNDSKPKIIDFVPLDDATEPVFKKDMASDSNYDTLEREKTFHVLNLAASTGAVKKNTTIPEHRDIKTAPSSSRMSFSAARKVFENLVENSADNVNEKFKSKTRETPLDKPIEIDEKASNSAAVKES